MAKRKRGVGLVSGRKGAAYRFPAVMIATADKPYRYTLYTMNSYTHITRRWCSLRGVEELRVRMKLNQPLFLIPHKQSKEMGSATWLGDSHVN